MRAATSSRISLNGSSQHRLAFVGGGPRCLYCLERLAAEISESHASLAGVEIVVFEPAVWPGAGCVYDLRQGGYLRINYAVDNIDVWSLRGHPRPPSLREWLLTADVGSRAFEDFVPRAVAGDYLHECMGIVVKELESFGCSVRFVESKVDRVEREPSGILLDAGDERYQFDDVVLVTGHEGWRGREEVFGVSPRGAPTVSHVFPVNQALDTARVEPGSTVAIRGFSLCFIDAALALTEGRGGVFHKSSTGFIYSKSSYEPAVIYPYCRSGRPMRCKPEPERMSLPRCVRTVWDEGRAWLEDRNLGKAVSFERTIWPIVLDCAERSLRLCGVKESVSQWLDDWMTMSSDPWDIFEELRKGCYISSGQRPVDGGWAIGESWRQLYSSFAPLIERGGLADREQWDRFWRIHQEMERIAFGPPLINQQKLVALVAAGRVRFDAVQAPSYRYEESEERFVSERYPVAVDVMVDAVLPGPHNLSENSLLGSLLADGFARRDRVSGGIEVAENGALIDETGEAASNLFYFGRATEGWLLGNDSLGRNPREGISSWASAYRTGKQALATRLAP